MTTTLTKIIFMGELWEILKKADVKGKGYDNH